MNSVGYGFWGTGGPETPPTVNCKNGTNTVKVESVLSRLETDEDEVAWFSLELKALIGASTTCRFTGVVGGSYENGGNTLTFASAAGISSSPFACGSAKLDAQFGVEAIAGEFAKFVF